MKTTECPYCREEIKPEAILCPHCHESLYPTRAHRIMNAVMVSIRHVVGAAISKPSVSSCGALCYAKFASDKPRLNECLDDCRIESAVVAIAEKLQRELIITMADIIWGGGDIDPLPFEKAMRERMSNPPRP